MGYPFSDKLATEYMTKKSYYVTAKMLDKLEIPYHFKNTPLP